MARAAITAIRERRRGRSGNPDKPVPACAYILRQLKHPKEIALLRHVYGQSVVVVAGHAPEERRASNLADTFAHNEGKATPRTYDHVANTLLRIDDTEVDLDEEQAKLGQNTRDTYPLADFFLDLAGGSAERVRRFIQLLFGHPFHTPSPEEMAMNQANAMALRSSDERRQVGAVVVSRTERLGSGIRDADIIASGMNEVPRRCGGFYWTEESPDGRDQELRRRNPRSDREDRIKSEALQEIAVRLKAKNWLAADLAELDDAKLGSRLLDLLKGTQFMDISEFMRQVHAEMAALVDAAKRGVAVRGTEMYVTTFPCHNCAKHIIAAGITKVIYLEPYPKSRVAILHEEEVALDPVHPQPGQVVFVPFDGVAPRQYGRLFSMSGRGRKHYHALKEWEEKKVTLSLPYVLANAAQGYVQTEREELELLPTEYKWDRAAICPK